MENCKGMIMNKEQTLKNIDQTIQAIEHFNELDNSHDVIDPSEKEMLLKAKENISNLRRKLATNELEVAVVGLEKAGKSMFSSAFVGESGIFPSADERCTFTSTKLQYGTENHAIVEFYGKTDFSQKFESMLDDVKFPNGKLESISLDSFESHFENLKQTDKGTYFLHSSKTETDIKDIITGRDKILKLLSQNNKTFQHFNSDELKSYITDKHISRAVKNVTFFSTNLVGLENIILYDVPGFDSPTQVHLAQTIKKLQDVDAIIMVKNVKMPSLKGGEVDILVQNGDMDGIKLYEKLFVFGSYADAVGSLEGLNKNKETLVYDLTKSLKNTFSRNRLFTGCLDSNYENNLKGFGSKTELNELKDSLKKYNEQERTLVLEKRINKGSEEIKNAFRDIIARNHHESKNLDGLKIELALSLIDDSRRKIEDSLSKFIIKENDDISINKIFTTAIIEKIDEIMPDVESNYLSDVIAEIKSSDTRSIANYEELNIKAREKITKEVKGNFIELVLEISKKKAGEIETGTIELFLNAFGVGAHHPKYKELSESVKSYVYDNTFGRRFDGAGFKAIVERFTVDLIDTMIGFPLASDARENRFMAGRRELYMLSLFSQSGMTHPPYKSDLVSLVLTQSASPKDELAREKSYLSEIRQAVKNKGAGGDMVNELVKLVTEKAITKNIPLLKILDKINAIRHLPTDPYNAAMFVYNMVNSFISDETLGLNDETTYIKGMLGYIKNAKSEDDVKNEIEQDIQNLVLLFKDCAIEAICLELPFNSSITYFVDTLKTSIKEEVFRKFIQNNIRDIKYHDFSNIDDQTSKSEIKSKILSEMNRIVGNLSR